MLGVRQVRGGVGLGDGDHVPAKGNSRSPVPVVSCLAGGLLPKLPNFHEKPVVRVLMGNLSEEMRRKKTFLVRGQCWQWLGAGKAVRVEGVRGSLGCQNKAGGSRRVRRARALQSLPGADWEGP